MDCVEFKKKKLGEREQCKKKKSEISHHSVDLIV